MKEEIPHLECDVEVFRQAIKNNLPKIKAKIKEEKAKDIKTEILITSLFAISVVVFTLGMIALYKYDEIMEKAQKQAVEWSEFGSPYKVYQVAGNEMMLYNAKDTIFVLFEQDLNSTERIVFLTRK